MLVFLAGVVTGVYITGVAWRYNVEIRELRDPSAGEQWSAFLEALKWPWMVVQTVRDIWREEP